METGQRLRLAKVVGDGGVNWWSTQHSMGSKTTLYGTKLGGTCHSKIVQTHRLYITRSELQSELWTQAGNDMSMRIHQL